MFNFEDAQIEVSKDEILAKISEYQLWKFYCHNFQEIDKSFLSELYVDSKPSCRIYINDKNVMCYKDFGTGDHYDIFGYIQAKYSCTFHECLNIIAADFKIRDIKVDIIPTMIAANDNIPIINIPKVKSRIEIVSQNYTSIDANYWLQFGIPLQLIEDYNVFSAKFAYLHKGDKNVVFEYKRSNPIYAYRFTNDGKYTYKLYFPYADKKYKWLFSGGAANDIEGHDQLDLHGDILILTKSLKDCMAFRLFNLNAISLQGEANKLEAGLVTKLLRRFDKIIVNYDNDDQGIKSAKGLVDKYKFDNFVFDEAKDLSDLIKLKGIDYTKEVLKNKLKMKLKMNSKYEF